MLSALFDRLRQSGKFPDVQISEDVDSIVGAATAADDGTLFVIPWREKAGRPRLTTGGHQQRVETQFLTVLLTRQHGDPRGATRAARFETLKGSVEALLAGWTIAPGSDAFALVASESGGLGNSVSIYIQTWQTTRFLIGEPQ